MLAQKGTQVAAPPPGGGSPRRGRERSAGHDSQARQAQRHRGREGQPGGVAECGCVLSGRGPHDDHPSLPEGSPVKKGQIVCELDSAALKDQLINQRITVKSAEANYENAKLAREVAEIAVVEYSEGIYKSEMKVLKDAVTAAQSAIQKADARLERTRLARKRVQDMLATKGAASTPADIVAELDIEDRLESAELTLLRERMALDQAKNKQDLLEKITLPQNHEGIERRRRTQAVGRARQEGDLGA